MSGSRGFYGRPSQASVTCGSAPASSLFPAILLLAALAFALVSRPAHAVDCAAVQPVDWGDYRVLVVGDSWAYQTMIALNAEFAQTPGLEQIRATGHAWWQCTTLYAGSTAAQWNTDEFRLRVANALKAYPTVDVVHIILGLNDIRTFGADSIWDSYARERALSYLKKTEDQRKTIYAGVTSNLNGLIQFILAQKPGIRVVLASYDYTNQIDPPEDFRPSVALAAGPSPVPATNPWFWQQLSNWQLSTLERYKQGLATSNPQVTYMFGLGLLQFKKGYQLDSKDYDLNDFTYPDGYGPSAWTADQTVQPGAAPPPWYGGFPFLPTPASMMMDRFHLNPEGYQVHAWWAVQNFYKSYFAPAK